MEAEPQIHTSHTAVEMLPSVKRERLGAGDFRIGFHWSKLLLPAKEMVPPSWPYLLQLPTSAQVNGWQVGADPAENDPSKMNKPGKKKGECTAGGRGETAGEPLSPEAFFQATHANFETTPSVTDRDVKTSVPEQSCMMGTPLLPRSTHLAALHGRGQLGSERRAGGGVLLRAFWKALGAGLGTCESCRGGRRNGGRKEVAIVTGEGFV